MKTPLIVMLSVLSSLSSAVTTEPEYTNSAKAFYDAGLLPGGNGKSFLPYHGADKTEQAIGCARKLSSWIAKPDVYIKLKSYFDNSNSSPKEDCENIVKCLTSVRPVGYSVDKNWRNMERTYRLCAQQFNMPRFCTSYSRNMNVLLPSNTQSENIGIDEVHTKVCYHYRTKINTIIQSTKSVLDNCSNNDENCNNSTGGTSGSGTSGGLNH
jgi:hypothetical protein